MATKERFVVRTSLVDPAGKLVVGTTVAEGRPMAIKQAERIGKFDHGHDGTTKVVAFLEGAPFDENRCTWIRAGGYSGWDGVACIYPIDE